MSRRALLAVLLLAAGALGATPAVVDNPPLVKVEDMPVALRAADFDGDTKLDFAVLTRPYFTTSGAVRVRVYRGKGDGTFHPPVQSTVADGAAGFDVGLLDGDAVLDILVLRPTGYLGSALQMYRGLGNGTFAAHGGELSAPSCTTRTLSVADMTGDGRADATCDLTVFPNLGGGTFGTAMQAAPAQNEDQSYVVDANGDGKRDVVLSGSFVTLYLGNGNGTFDSGTTIDYDGGARTSTMADFDGNGRADLAVIDEGLFVKMAGAAGAYPTRTGVGAVEQESTLTTADLNGDGRPDLIAGGSSLVSVWIAGADGALAPRTLYAAGTRADLLATGDFDGDGATDVLTGGVALGSFDDGLVSLLRGAGNGTLHAMRAYAASRATEWGSFLGGAPTGAAVSDVTSDGKSDLIVVDTEAASIAVFAGRGNGTFDDVAQYTTLPNSFWTRPLFTDLDGDGRLDVIVPGSFLIYVFLANGDGTFRQTTSFQGYTSHEPTYDTGDFNGDGHADFVHLYGGVLSFRAGNGDGTFDEPVSGSYPSLSYTGFRVGDVNGDGRDDLASAGVMLLGGPTGTFTSVATGNAMWGTPPLLADLDGDGKLDAIDESSLSDIVSTWVRKGNGDGTFGPPLGITRAPSPGAAQCAGDFNGDGHADLAGKVILLGDGSGRFDGYANVRDARTATCSVADVDGNGSDDLLSLGEAVSVIRTRTAESLARPLSLTIEPSQTSAPAASSFLVTAYGSSDTSLMPAGAVIFSIGDTVVAAGELVDGVARGYVSGTVLGSQTLTARYTGDDVYAAAEATPRQIEITRALTSFTTTLLPRYQGLTTLDVVRYTGTVDSNLPGITGTVTLFVDNVARETQNAPRFDFVVGTLAAGRRRLRLEYSGDATHLPYTGTDLPVDIAKPEMPMNITLDPPNGATVGTPVTIRVEFPSEPQLTGTVNIINAGTTFPVAISGGGATLTSSSLVPSETLGVSYPGDARYRATTRYLHYPIADAPAVSGPTSLYLVEPCRLLDTRDTLGGPIGSNAESSLYVARRCGVPFGTKAVAVNVIAVNPVNTGYLTVFPNATARPYTSTINYRSGRTRANNAVIPLSAGGLLKLYNSGPSPVHVIVDVTGYFQ